MGPDRWSSGVGRDRCPISALQGRLVRTKDGTVRFEARNASGLSAATSMEQVNIKERDMFQKGEVTGMMWHHTHQKGKVTLPVHAMAYHVPEGRSDVVPPAVSPGSGGPCRLGSSSGVRRSRVTESNLALAPPRRR